jgi:hypothetical protein
MFTVVVFLVDIDILFYDSGCLLILPTVGKIVVAAIGNIILHVLFFLRYYTDQ